MSCNGGKNEINSGSNCNIPCDEGLTDLIPMGPCACTPCPTAAPYFSKGGACLESHKQVVIQQQYVTGVTTASAFNMPACNGTTRILIPGLQVIPVGSFLWNPTYGYLLVTDFDYASETITVENTCLSGNAAPGTLIPTCTVFTVSDSPQVPEESPCDWPENSIGSILVCGNGDVPSILHPGAAGQIPTSTGIGDQVQFESYDLVTRDCTTLSQNLTIIGGNAGPYVLHLVDTSAFSVGEYLQIDSRTDRLRVDHITSGIQLEGTFTTTPGAGAVVLAGTSVCAAPCCEQIDKILNTTSGASSAIAPQDLTSGNTLYSNTSTLIVPNYGIGAVNCYIVTRYDDDLWYKTSGVSQTFNFTEYLQVATNLCAIGAHTPGVLATIDNLYTEWFTFINSGGGAVPFHSLRNRRSIVTSIPAGQELVLTSRTGVKLDSVTTPATDKLYVNILSSSSIAIWLSH